MDSELRTYREAVSAEVRALMARRRTNQTQLAEVIGTDQSGVSRRLRCKTAFDLDDIMLMARYFNVGLATLLPEPASVASDGGGDQRISSAGCTADSLATVTNLFADVETPFKLAVGQ